MQSDKGTIHMKADIEVQTNRRKAFAFWRDIENIPRFMTHIKEIKAVGKNRYHWRMEGPAGINFNWEADVVDIVDDSEFTWRTVPNAQVKNTGNVKFIDRGHQKTHILVSFSYVPPAGPLGHRLATMLNLNPGQQLQTGLVACKKLLEQPNAAVAPPRAPALNGGADPDEENARYSAPFFAGRTPVQNNGPDA